MGSTGNIGGSDMKALAAELQALGVPSSYYSLGQHRDERTCLVETDGEWLVYFAERGQREDLHRFSSFTDARQYLLTVVRE